MQTPPLTTRVSLISLTQLLGSSSSDAGALLLGSVDQGLELIEGMAGCLQKIRLIELRDDRLAGKPFEQDGTCYLAPQEGLPDRRNVVRHTPSTTPGAFSSSILMNKPG